MSLQILLYIDFCWYVIDTLTLFRSTVNNGAYYQTMHACRVLSSIINSIIIIIDQLHFAVNRVLYVVDRLSFQPKCLRIRAKSPNISQECQLGPILAHLKLVHIQNSLHFSSTYKYLDIQTSCQNSLELQSLTSLLINMI